MLVFLSISISAVAQATPDIQTFLKHGLEEVQISLGENFKSQLMTDKSCPAGGTEVVENMVEKKGKLLSAVGTMQSILSETSASMGPRKADASRCGSCKQTNVVSTFAVVNPEKTTSTPECENRPTETFAQNFANSKDLQDYTQDLLKGKGDDGKRLEKNCPNPCAYYITTAQTVLPDGKTHLTLAIQCGQPRKDGIFSASYNFKAGLIHQWTCTQ
jgi:hypothetical protein